jgi:hypothetical protein
MSLLSKYKYRDDDRDGDRPRRVDNRPEDVNRGSTSLLVRNLAYDVRCIQILMMMMFTYMNCKRGCQKLCTICFHIDQTERHKHKKILMTIRNKYTYCLYFIELIVLLFCTYAFLTSSYGR